LTNLLSNAIKFSFPNSEVRLACELRESCAVFSVSDHGRGIPFEKLANVFEKFSQVEPADGSQKGGTGLGLAICRQIIERQEGHIWAESRIGEGSTFYFSLPLARSAFCLSCAEAGREWCSHQEALSEPAMPMFVPR
jgi:signal transduction histidine kinase